LCNKKPIHEKSNIITAYTRMQLWSSASRYFESVNFLKRKQRCHF